MKKLISIVLVLILGCACRERTIYIDTDNINVMKDEAQPIHLDLHSKAYLLIDLSDFTTVYAHDADKRIYPASLTKMATLDTILNLFADLSATSSVSNEQVEYLISEDASLAYIQRDYPYSLKDLLYALMLPSGADAAWALENYCQSKGIDLITAMNEQMLALGCRDSHFVNSTGLHADDHYTSLNDLFTVLMDILKYEEGRKIMETMLYKLADGQTIYATFTPVYAADKVQVLGGKTGYTPEAGQNIVVLYRNKGKSYVVFLANAMGGYELKQYWHFDDALNIFENIY